MNRYERLIEAVFAAHYRDGMGGVAFTRDDIVHAAQDAGLSLPKNLGDLLYTFRYRARFPGSIADKAPEGYQWIIRPAGRARYQFVLVTAAEIVPSAMLAETKIPDATPGLISRYALSDEQALLARLRYNRLVDVFTGLTCYSLQNHLRTTAPGIGQVETDEIYVGIDKRGVHYVLPVQAKAASDRIGIVQVEQDLAVCKAKFPALACRPIAAQFVSGEVIALFETELTPEGIRVVAEKHYRLVPSSDLTNEELAQYQRRSE